MTKMMKKEVMMNEIRSLKDIRKRKSRIKRELVLCEEEMHESYYRMTHPVEWFRSNKNDKNKPDNGNAFQKVLGVAGMAISVISMIKGIKK